MTHSPARPGPRPARRPGPRQPHIWRFTDFAMI